MARTKASIGVKVASGKSSKARCSAASTSSGSGSSGGTSGGGVQSRSSGSGNRVCPRDTPAWQRRITHFFRGMVRSGDDQAVEETMNELTKKEKPKPKPKRNVIQSDDEENPMQIDDDKASGSELDDTIELAPLTGEDSRKIVEFFPKSGENSNGSRLTDTDGEQSSSKSEMDEGSGPNTAHEDNFNPIGKCKGQGKRSKQKENIDTNVEQRKSMKRDLEDITADDDDQHSSKRVKVV